MTIIYSPEIGEPQIQQIADAHCEDFCHWSLSDIFSSVADIKNHVIALHKKSGDTGQFIDESADWSVTPIKALTKLSELVRYSTAYNEFVKFSLNATLQKALSEKPFWQTLLDWSRLKAKFPLDDVKSMIKEFRRYQNEESDKVLGTITDIKITETPIEFFEQDFIVRTRADGKKERHRLGGYFEEFTSKDGTTNRVVRVNTLNTAFWTYDPVQVMGEIYHETIHDHQSQLGQSFADATGLSLGDLEADAEKWHVIKQKSATIPVGIYSPYMAQFHEVAAYQFQREFEGRLQCMVDFFLRSRKRHNKKPAFSGRPYEGWDLNRGWV